MEIDVGFFIILSFIMLSLLVFRHWVWESNCALRKDEFVGPAYWGAYEDQLVIDSPEMRKIPLRKPSELKPIYTVGSGRYASGNAVKSARG